MDQAEVMRLGDTVQHVGDHAAGEESQQAWAHTSSVLALLANLHRDPKKTRAYRPADFNPHVGRKPVTIQKVGISVLKQVFVDNRQGGN